MATPISSHVKDKNSIFTASDEDMFFLVKGKILLFHQYLYNEYPYYMVKPVLALRLINLKPTLTNCTAVMSKTVDMIYTSGKILFTSCTSGHVHLSCWDSTYTELSSVKRISSVDNSRDGI